MADTRRTLNLRAGWVQCPVTFKTFNETLASVRQQGEQMGKTIVRFHCPECVGISHLSVFHDDPSEFTDDWIHDAKAIGAAVGEQS